MHMSRPTRLSIVTAYWAAVTLGSLALIFSMVTTLWGPRAPNPQASLAERRTWCVGQLALLQAELEHETQAAIGPYAKATEEVARRRARWQRSWQERLASVDAQCPKPAAIHQALAQLGALSSRYDAIVVSWQSAQNTLRTPIEMALQQLVQPWPQQDADDVVKSP